MFGWHKKKFNTTEVYSCIPTYFHTADLVLKVAGNTPINAHLNILFSEVSLTFGQHQTCLQLNINY